MPVTTSDSVEAFLRRRNRATLKARVALVTHELAQWRAYEADQALPPEQRTGVPCPSMARERLEHLWVPLVDEQGRYGSAT